MLFLLKRRWTTGLIGLFVLAALGLSLRLVLPAATAFNLSATTILIGVGVSVGIVASDAILHRIFCLAFGEPYRARHRELAQVFRDQSWIAILAGALMAGAGEELVFRGLGTHPAYLVSAAVVFGLLHHIRTRLWPFTVWAVYEGLLFAAALWWTESLIVTMVAHFLHDLAGFGIFRYLNRMGSGDVRG